MSNNLKNYLNNISIVLVRTIYPGNIGSVARAMKTMGIYNLILVDSCDTSSPQVSWLAANALDIVQNAKHYNTLKEAVANFERVITTSARSRHLPWPTITPEEIPQLITSSAASLKTVIIFGPEDRGMTNEELQIGHFHLQILANDEYPILNLSSAVQIVTYEIFKHLQLELNNKTRLMNKAIISHEKNRHDWSVNHFGIEWDEDIAKSEQLERLFGHFEQTLKDVSFINPKKSMKVMNRLRRIFMRSTLDKKEVKILHGICSAISKKVNSENQKKTDK